MVSSAPWATDRVLHMALLAHMHTVRGLRTRVTSDPGGCLFLEPFCRGTGGVTYVSRSGWWGVSAGTALVDPTGLSTCVCQPLHDPSLHSTPMGYSVVPLVFPLFKTILKRKSCCNRICKTHPIHDGSRVNSKLMGSISDTATENRQTPDFPHSPGSKPDFLFSVVL